MFCTGCGAAAVSGAQFCVACGRRAQDPVGLPSADGVPAELNQRRTSLRRTAQPRMSSTARLCPFCGREVDPLEPTVADAAVKVVALPREFVDTGANYASLGRVWIVACNRSLGDVLSRSVVVRACRLVDLNWQPDAALDKALAENGAPAEGRSPAGGPG